MSLPSIIADPIKTIPYNPGIVSTDPELAYTLSFASYPISNDSVHFHPRDSYHSPLAQYQFADFDDSTYDHLLEQTTKNYRAKNVSVIKGIRSSFKEFYARLSALTYQSALKYNHRHVPKHSKPFEVSKLELEFRIQGIKGNIPSKWPEGLNEFQNEINALPWNAFSTESYLLLEDVTNQIKIALANLAKKVKATAENERGLYVERLAQISQVLIKLSLKTLSQSFILQQVLSIQNLLQESQILPAQERAICSRLSDNLKTYLKQIPKQDDSTVKYHKNEHLWDTNSFLLMKKIHFHKVAGLAYYSVTTDGQYLYVYVSAINGGMFKFGTGNGGTVAGKLYFEKQINLPIGAKLDEVNWVYLKDKLYLKNSSKDPSSLDVYSASEFKKLGTVQLACKSLFGHNVLLTMNKNSILLTDGEHLYFLGKRIKITQNNILNKAKTEDKKQDPQQQTDKNPKKQKKKKKKQDNNQLPAQQNAQQPDATDQSIKLLEMVLVQFDIDGKLDDDGSEAIDQQAIQEIFESFSGYFTKDECKRAYRLNHYDIMETCQWLFDQGNKEKEKSIKILPMQRTVVLCESEITSNFNEKTFKNTNEIVTKDGSLLHIFNVNESIWTMDTQEITCYSQSGVKIFSKKPNDDKKKPQKLQQNPNFLTKTQTKYPRNPQYMMIHDPYNKLFYTFTWPSDGHYFPCAVLVSKDVKEEVSLEIQRRHSVDTSVPVRFGEIGKYFLTELSLLEMGESKNYQFTDHVWWYGQKINKLNVESNTANADDKKKISNKKAKVMTKLNKINEITKTHQKDIAQFMKNGKVVKEIIKLYPFSSDGSMQSVNHILEAFKNIENRPQNSVIASFLVCIEKWLINSSQLTSQQLQNKISQVHNILIKIRNAPVTSENNRHQINRIIIRNFDTFYRGREEAINFLVNLPIQEIQRFLNYFGLNQGKSSKESIVYEIAKKELLIAKYDSKYNFTEIFKEQSQIKEPNKNMIAFLMMRKQSQTLGIHSSLLTFIENCIMSSESPMITEFFTTLFTSSLKEIHKLKASEQKIHYLANLFEDSFRILEKCLSACSVSKTLSLIPTISFITQVYFSSAVRLLGNANIIKSLLKIIELVQKPELIGFYDCVKNLEFEGVSAIQERVYETCHPLERGKSQSFPSANFPEASLLFLEFDKRCQSDQNHDIMTIQLIHEDSGVGNSIQCHDGVFSTNLRLTGKIQMKKPVLMLGNNVSVDFTSSGHAKDAQSFGRFGFKFGLRPISTGKIIYEKSADTSKLQKVLKSKENFKSYINTLKLLVVTASATLEGLFSVEQDHSSQAFKTLLQGKIIRQGLQESKQIDQQNNYSEIINKFLLKDSQDPQKDIIKKINIGLMVADKKENDKFVTQKQSQKDLWNTQGIPQYIRAYIEQIRNFNGNFIDVFKQARVHAPPQGTYLHQLRRPGFTPQLRQHWLQGQALLFLTVLKHSGLLHLNLKFSIQYIKQNLKAFQQARNGIFYAFISRMQIMREWRDLVETYHAKKEEQVTQKEVQVKGQERPKQQKKELFIRKHNRVVRTVQFQKKEVTKMSAGNKKAAEKEAQKSKQELQKERIKNVEKQIRERLSDQYRIQQLCNLKKLPFIPNNPHQNIAHLLQAIKSTTPSTPQHQTPVYLPPIQHLIRSCLFLLSCKSPSTRETLQQQHDIEPMALGRSLSSDHRNVDNNKVEIFREWLENWKKWKGFRKENKVEFRFPVLEIVDFVNSWVDVGEVKKMIEQRTRMCYLRCQYFKHLNGLMKSTSQSIMLSKYVFGTQLIHLSNGHKAHLQSAPLTKLQQLEATYKDYINTIKDIESKFVKEELTIGYKRFLDEVRGSKESQAAGQKAVVRQKEFLNKLRINSEIIYMIQSQNPKMSLQLALYFMNFKFLSNQNEELLFLASLIVNRAFLVEHSLSEVLDALRKQVGNNTLAAKRWKDLLFIERVLFLIRKLEAIIRKKQLELEDKEKIAQTLFYLLNLTDIPSISKISLKLLKKLKEVDFKSLPNLFNYRYRQVTLTNTNKAISQKYLSINPKHQNNLQLLSKKTLSIFRDQQFKPNLVVQKLLNPQFQPLNKQPPSKPIPQTYTILLNIHQQQDLVWFLRVMYYIQELQRQSGKGSIPSLKDWKEYVENKSNKQNKKNQQQQQQQANQQAQNNVQVQAKNMAKGNIANQKEDQLKERILTFVPEKISDIDEKLQDELPLGWYMSYCNVYKDYTNNNSQKSSKPQKKTKYHLSATTTPTPTNKKAWQSTMFLKLSKKFQQLNTKGLQQPKQTDPEQAKQQFIKAKNFVIRMRKHMAEILQMISMFTNYGYVVFREQLPKEKAVELCDLISLGAENKLKPIKMDWVKEEYKTKIMVEDSVGVGSKVKITLIESDNFAVFEQLVMLETTTSITNDNPTASYVQINKKEHVLQDAIYQPFEDFLDIDSSSDSQNKQTEFCKEFINSRIFKMKKREEEVYLPDYPKLKYFIAQGGIETGLKNVTLVPASEHSLTLQTVPFQDVLTKPSTQVNEQQLPTTETVQQIIQKLINLIKSKLASNQPINTEEKIMDYLLVSFYLKKLSKMQLKSVRQELLKKLAGALVGFGVGFNSFQTIEHYESEMQTLLIKLIDNKQPYLKMFEIFNREDYEMPQTISNYVVKAENGQKVEDANKDIREDITTHHFPKSEYLLKTQGPQVEQNKLLKYWEKNILPKILDFVKTTLRPLEIQDFFQQMRMPLRKNDQMQAKKIAYVICDNKLPQGAVLPDSNHNWNSFSLEDITIGQYALVKLPKHVTDSISPLLMTGHQQYRLVKIVFIDIKAPSILVRYRIDQYGMLGYAWMPINSLVRVEKEIIHLSPQHLYKEIEKNIKGMIYGYSKLCLTQLTEVSDLDQSKLIKETIADLFIHDPISGWLSPPTSQWSMRHSLKSMMDNNELQIIDYLEKQFCHVQSYETDLFTDQVVKLNRFQNSKALIVSFKKTAAISLTSGIKFYKDPYMFNQIMHVYTTKTQKTQFQPLIFNDPNVFCKYYTNKECLKPSELNKYAPKAINVTVFGVSEVWTIGCYLGEVISQMAQQTVNVKYLEILRRLNRLYVKWILDKKVAVLCSELAKLVARISNRIIAIQERVSILTTAESLGIDEQMAKDLFNWIKVILQQEQATPLSLYSQLLQNVSQMCAVMFRKILPYPKGQTLPVHIQAMINLQNLLIRINDHLKGQKITQKPQPSGQWQRLLLIQKIPAYMDHTQLITKIKQIISDNKGKILTPKFDIYPKNDKLCVCVEGWNITELVEEEIVQKIEKEDQEQQKEQQQGEGLMMQWQCGACTMLNPVGNTHCEVCGTEMPPPPAAKQVYQQVQATDVSKAQNKLKQLQAKRFEAVKQQIHEFFFTYWQEYCKKAQKRNKQLEETAKNKVVMRNKKEKEAKEQDKSTMIPEKPDITLTTGSNILSNPIIQDFLSHRWGEFKENVKKLVQNEENFLGKFKKLQNLGYDLWCDNIHHDNPSLIPFQRLYQLMNYIQGEICKGSSSVLSYSQNSIRLLSTIPLLQDGDEPINYQVENNIGVKAKYKNLAELKSYNIRYSWKIVKELNVAASKCLQFINMNLKHSNNNDSGDTPKYSDCLGTKIKCFRNLIMGAIKLQLTQKIIQKTSVLREPQEMPKVYLERLRVSRQGKWKQNKIVTVKDKDEFLFTKAHEQFAKVSPAMLRPFKPKGTDPYLSFSITFRGQMAMGQAGPYRQFFTDISNQLDPKNHLGLFIPTPNNEHNSGQAKSKWTLNPKANSGYHLSLYEFIGILMGCCIRTGTHLALDLPKMFWKLLVSQTITDVDLQQCDNRFVETLKMIKDIPNKQMFDELQEYSQPVTWVYTTSDGEEHEIFHNGKGVKVTFEERERYIAAVKRKRVNEAILQVNRIKRGLQEMMPEAYFNCITGDELKLMVCGRPKVDVDLLKKHTKYAGGLHEEQRRIKYFWQVMHQIDQSDKLKVIKFCWGQQRLPINSQEFQRNNIRFMIKPMMNQKKSDQSLPKADTCFFNIELPNYTTKEVMKAKLLLAINMDCVSINADENFNPDDNPLMNEIEEEMGYEEVEDGEEW